MVGVRVSPTEALDLDRSFKNRLNWNLVKERIRNRWKFPEPAAATSFDEMTLLDIYYWVYKCRRPIARPEKYVNMDALINRDPKTLRLPTGFTAEKTLTFGAGGDLLQSPGLENAKDQLFEDVADLLFDRDISYANIESPVTTQPLVDEVISNKAAPIECCNLEQFEALCTHKGKPFTILNTANNHMADMGLEGVESTLAALKKYNIVDTGTNYTPAEHGKAHFIEKNGIKIGLVSVTFGLNGQVLPPGEEYRINVSRLVSKVVAPELDLTKRQIDDCRKNGADLVLISLHWGFEFEFYPRVKQIDIAHELAEYGGDLIIGNHPHVIQPTEFYKTKRDLNRIVPIAYSLGSLTWGYSDAHLALSSILNLTISKGKLNGKTQTFLDQAEVTPIFRSYFKRDDKNFAVLRKVRNFVGTLDERHSSSYLNKIRTYADMIIRP